MSNEEKITIGSSEEIRIVPHQEDNANIGADDLLCDESAADALLFDDETKANIGADSLLCDESPACLFDDDSELNGMDYVMSDQTVGWNEDNMVTPVQLKVAADDDIVADGSPLWHESSAVIFGNCRQAEEKSRTFLNTLKMEALTPKYRAVLIDWLVKMCVHLKLQTDTLYSSVNLVNWFFSTSFIEVGKHKLLGISCLLIALKYEELQKSQPRIEDFHLDTEDACGREQIIDMEKQVFKEVGCHLVDPTTYTFLRMFLVVAEASTKLQCMSSFLAELSLGSQKFVLYLPSRVAASALFLAKWTLDPSRNPWGESLEKFTTYKSCELKSIVFDLQALQRQIDDNVCTIIHIKYSKPKFQHVAALYSDDLDDTMF